MMNKMTWIKQFNLEYPYEAKCNTFYAFSKGKIIEWLHENVPNAWCFYTEINPVEIDGIEHPVAQNRTIRFKDEEGWMAFKLVWGESFDFTKVS